MSTVDNFKRERKNNAGVNSPRQYTFGWKQKKIPQTVTNYLSIIDGALNWKS